MRFFVFIDLLGTLILPATVVYLVYLIIVVSTGNAPFPTISIIMLAVTYGLQAIIFILHREFMLVGWMIVYILSYPINSFFLPIYSFWCMDEFGWGNTRLVVGEGANKKVVINEDEKFDDSMIPLKKFSEYEAEAWESVSQRSNEKSASNFMTQNRSPGLLPHSRDASQQGDYYRDTNLTYNNASNPNLRLGKKASASQLSMSQAPQAPVSFAPQLPFMPWASGPGSAIGSDHGGMSSLNFANQNRSASGGFDGSRMNAMSGYGAFGQMGTPGGLAAPTLPAARMSTFSMATSAAFGGPSDETNPTDDEIFTALRNYLSVQDLMSVTKKSTREAMAGKFPKADLSSRKDFINQSIDRILSQPS